jgi:hypothetical protein
VILGLSRLDIQLASQLAQNDFLEILKKKHTPTFESLLSPRGRQAWGIEPSPPPTPGEEFESDRTYPHLDAPAIKDESGRAPFAAALARHLRYIRAQII